MNLPAQLTTTVPSGTLRFVPTARILPSLMIMVAFVSVVFASFTMVALVNAYCPCLGSATPFSGKVDWARANLPRSKTLHAMRQLFAFFMLNVLDYFVWELKFRRGLI